MERTVANDITYGNWWGRKNSQLVFFYLFINVKSISSYLFKCLFQLYLKNKFVPFEGHILLDGGK